MVDFFLSINLVLLQRANSLVISLRVDSLLQ